MKPPQVLNALPINERCGLTSLEKEEEEERRAAAIFILLPLNFPIIVGKFHCIP